MADTQLALLDAPSLQFAGSNPGVPISWVNSMEQHPAWPVLSRIALPLAVQVPLNRIKVRDLLRLSEGQILASVWSHTHDVPLTAGAVRLAWSEFEISGEKIGVRLTQLA